MIDAEEEYDPATAAIFSRMILTLVIRNLENLKSFAEFMAGDRSMESERALAASVRKHVEYLTSVRKSVSAITDAISEHDWVASGKTMGDAAVDPPPGS